MGAAGGHQDTRQVELLERKATERASKTKDGKREVLNDIIKSVGT